MVNQQIKCSSIVQRHILIHGVESWSGVEPWSGVVFLELFFLSQCKSFKVRDE